MKFEWVGKIPVPIIYFSWLTGKYDAKCWGLFIAVDSNYKNDNALLQHELTHVKQFWRSKWTMIFKYYFSRKWRLIYEVEAYRVQIQHGFSHELASFYLSYDYDLKINVREASELLQFRF